MTADWPYQADSRHTPPPLRGNGASAYGCAAPRAQAARRLCGWRLACLAAVASLYAAMAPADETAVAGRELYLRYCSACHGPSGAGDGMVGQLLTPRPTDLTQLAERNGGTFPFEAVVEAIDGRRSVRAHGAANMPVWGDVLGRQPPPAATDAAAVRAKLLAITAYVQSIQRP